MGKGKKGRKQQDDDWENDLDEIAKEAGIEIGGSEKVELDITQPSKKKEKKKKKGKAVDNDEEADDEDMPTSKKPGFSALMMDDDSADDVNSEDDDQVIMATQKNKKNKKKDKAKPSFSALMLDDEEDADEDAKSEEEEPVLSPTPKNKKKGSKAKPSFADLDIEDQNGHASSDDEKTLQTVPSVETVSSTSTKASKKKKKKGKAQEEEDDIADILADLEVSDKPKEKKSKKKGKAAVDIDMENGEEDAKADAGEDILEEDAEKVAPDGDKTVVEDQAKDDPEEGRMKTAAEKKAEKKLRDKKKKEAEKKKAAKKKDVTSQDASDVTQTEVSESADVAVSQDVATEEIEAPTEVPADGDKADAGDPEAGGSDEEEATEGKDKKKKKKKKKKTEEDDKKKTKKPNKAAVAQMQAALEAVEREKERLRLEEEAKQKAFEEAEEKRLEKVRLDQERKDKKKQKEKERKERLKKEGKLLTPAQREQKRRAEAMLEAMKQQYGANVPTKDPNEQPQQKKKVVYGKKKKPQQKAVNGGEPAVVEAAVPEKEEPAPVVQEEPPPPVVEEKKEEPEKDDVADSWDAEENEDIADSWDASDGEEEKAQAKVEKAEPVKVEPVKVEAKKISKEPSKEEESEDDEDDEDEESDDESESESETDSDDSEEESSSEEEDDKKLTPEKIKERARDRIMQRRLDAENKRTTDKLRAPVICVLGHVDTGKTKILDKIRRTNVQDGEAGGITQQIGATNIPKENIQTQCKHVKEFQEFDMKIPGLLIIDTPGHESFSNLRSRGSNLCDMAILVVDIMHGLEPQTIESINLLKKKQTPFVVALNKIDRIFEWKKSPQMGVEETIKKQKKMSKQDFEERLNKIIGEFAEQGLNAALHYKNPDVKSYISLVPTSAHSGDGMGDLIAIICRLTQSRLAKKLAFSEQLQSTVMEVKAIPGLGMTIDVILVNGRLKEGDTIVTGGIDGAVITQIRSVLTPQPMRELRVKAQYIHHQSIEAAQGVKLCGKDLDKVLAGSPLFVAHQPDEVDVLKDEVEDFVSSSLKAIKVTDRGVYVQASTLGSLEALLEFLKTSKIPYCGVNIGPVHRRDVMKASVMLEHEPMYAVILAFDVKVEREAQEFADKEGVKIFTAEIIYHLFDQFTAYTEDYKQKKRDEFKHLAVYPCKLRIMPEHIFNTRDPIVVGVHVESGTCRLGTPITVHTADGFVNIGFCTGLEANHKPLEKASTGMDVCAKFEPVPGEAPKLLGRHFTVEDLLVSRVSRESIDVMKQYFREDMTKADWQLIIELKKLLDIV